MTRIIFLCGFSFLLSGCSTLSNFDLFDGSSGKSQPAIALYQVNELNQESIQIACTKAKNGWESWSNTKSKRRVTSNTHNWIATYQGRQLASFTSYPGSTSSSGQITLQTPLSRLVQRPMVSSDIAYPGLAQRPVILRNIPVIQTTAVSESFTPNLADKGMTLSAFDNFLDNGLIEKGTIAAEDFRVIEAAEMQNGDKIVTYSVYALSNADDGKHQRFKSFYIKKDKTLIDISQHDDVDLSKSHSTGTNVRFIDVVNVDSDILALFWFWNGTKKGYRLLLPQENRMIDMNIE